MRVFAFLLKKNHLGFIRNRTSLLITLLFPWITSGFLQIAMTHSSKSEMYLFFCNIFCFWFFFNLGVRLVIGEKQVLLRELYAGLSPFKYLASKFWYFSLVGIYTASVFSVSVSINWLDWYRFNQFARGYFIEEPLAELDKQIEILDIDRDEDRWREADRKRELKKSYHEVREILLLRDGNRGLFTELFFVFRRLHSENPFGMILLKDESGWFWYPNRCNDGHLFSNWYKYKNHFSFWDRIGQQLLQLILLDFGFIIFFLACLTGLALGLLVSILAPSQEAAVHFVPYFTIFQIIMSKQVVGGNRFILLNGVTFGDMAGWDLGSIFSLLTLSRYLQTLIENSLASTKLTTITWTVLWNDYIPDFSMLFCWILIPLFTSWFLLRRWMVWTVTKK